MFETFHYWGDASISSLDLDINSARCDKGTHTSWKKKKISHRKFVKYISIKMSNRLTVVIASKPGAIAKQA